MKILFILFTKRYQGTFYRAFPWAEYLVSRGHDVTLLCTSSQKLFSSTVSTERGVRIIESPSLLFNERYVMTRLAGMSGWDPLDILTRYQEIRNGQYDIVHSFEHHMHVSLPIFLAGRKRIPALVSDWCDHYGQGGLGGAEYSPYRLRHLYYPIGFPLRKWTEHIEGALRRKADSVTVISSYLKQRALSKGVALEKIHRITGSAETERIQPSLPGPARRKLGLNEHLQYVLFFGAGQFDVEFSLEAFAQVTRTMPDTHFIVVGRKDDLIRRKADKLGVGDRLIQTGWVADDQLSGWLASTDICLLPMKDHAVNHARWPNKIGFYMAAGRPTVATEIGDVSRLISSRRIGLVSPVGPREFADRILQLLTHRELAEEMGARARYVAEREFQITIQGAELENLYTTLAGRSSPPE